MRRHVHDRVERPADQFVCITHRLGAPVRLERLSGKRVNRRVVGADDKVGSVERAHQQRLAGNLNLILLVNLQGPTLVLLVQSSLGDERHGGHAALL